MKLTPEIENRSIRISSSIIQSLKLMDTKKVKLLLVFDGDKFLSILTIGDIQRAIIPSAHFSLLFPASVESPPILIFTMYLFR